MTNKESLREKFFEKHVLLESRIFSNRLYFKTISTPEDVFDFFWNEIEQIRKEDMERVVDEITKLKKEKVQIPIPCPDGMVGCAVFHFKEVEPEDNKVIDQVLSIIKQSHE